MRLCVSEIIGLPVLPATKMGIHKWLKRNNIRTELKQRQTFFALSDLPPEVQRALLERDIAASGLSVGTYDDEAHAGMLDATPAMQAAAEAKAAVARDFLAIGSRMTWGKKLAFIRERHGADGTSEASLERILRAVKSGRSDQLRACASGGLYLRGTARDGAFRSRLVLLSYIDPRWWPAVSAASGMA